MNATIEKSHKPEHSVLIIDDEPANLRVITNYLEAHGIEVLIARDGEEGIEKAQYVRPDLILLDVRMPGIDGFETCRRLKSGEITKDIPVIFATIVTGTEDKVKGFEVGGLDYIPKPFQHEEVLARVVTHLRLRDLTRDLEEAKESLERRVEERTAALTQANQELQAEIAERRLAEAALKRERALIANIMETSPVGITMVSREGEVTFANAQAEGVLGLPKDEITQRAHNAPAWHITDFAGGPFPDEKLPFRQVMATGQPVYNMQHALEWPDGRRVFLSINGAPILDEAGEVESVVFALEDITERKRAEESLRESEQRYRIVFENSPVSIGEEDFSGVKTLLDDLKREGIADIETYFAQHPETVRQCGELIKLVEMNRAALTLHAAATKEEMLAGLVNTFTLESFDTLQQALICLWNGGIGMTKDTVIKTFAGESRNVTVYFSVCPGYEETLSKVLVSLVDITERRRMEEALRESENRYRRITESLTDYQYSVRVENGQAVETVQSPACEMVTGYTPEEFAANPYLWFRMVAPEDRDLVRERIQQILAGQEIPPIEYRILRKDGAVRWVCDTPILFKDAAGQLRAYEGVIKDVTERKQAEAEIRRLNQELEQRVLDRTAQLEATNKELEAFAYSVSHDLRAPLRHIDGFLELLGQSIAGTLDDRSRRYLDTIAVSARRMGQLIDDLLAFSRMGRNEMSKTTVNLGALAQEVIRELAPEIQDRSIHWCVADLPTVSGDRAMLRLVLVNLIANALKFTRERQQAEIEIGCQAGNKESIIFIRDNGVGFDMAYASKLFGVFQRLHRVDEFEGTGIGLANVRRIIQRHGGRVWAEGEVNQGATFYFSLPNYKGG